ncbi:hypothetical protein [Candidatus Tisiphia endosymbiont of Hybos culiciformis]|uniref:hypothetical protein n=1 Tax=Candidatus Tisiphia endosymbiont of Hybos culiciformis TaxID=3139331 RepID=UPI003CCA998E
MLRVPPSLREATLVATKQSSKLDIGKPMYWIASSPLAPRNDVLYFSAIFKLP